MRIILVGFTLMLAGCVGTSNDDAGNDADSSPNPDDARDDPALDTRSCTAILGGAVVTLTTAAGSIGGCDLGVVNSETLVVESTPGESCTIQVDVDGDDLADEEVQVGTIYASGTTFTAFCDLPAMNAENSVSLLAIV